MNRGAGLRSEFRPGVAALALAGIAGGGGAGAGAGLVAWNAGGTVVDGVPTSVTFGSDVAVAVTPLMTVTNASDACVPRMRNTRPACPACVI